MTEETHTQNSPHSSGPARQTVQAQYPYKRVRPSENTDVDIDIRALLLMLWRRKLIIVGVMLVGISITILALGFVQPRYSARSLILVEPKAEQFSPQIQNVIEFVRAESSMISNEIEIIRSRISARRVIERLNLITDPDFNPRYRQVLSQSGENPDTQERFKTFSFKDNAVTSLPADVIEREMASVVTRFLGGLNVRAIPGSNVVEIRYDSANPAKAALIANAVADEYIEQRLAAKFEASRKLTSWLDRRLEELREQVRASEEAVQNYKQRYNITEGAKSAVTVEQLSQLNTQLISAKAEQAEVEARLQEIQNLAQDQSRIETANEVINSRLIQELKRDEADLLRRLSDLSVRYGERHPEIINLKTELVDLQGKLQSEMSKIIEGMRNEVAVVRARVKTLQQGIDEIKDTRHQENEAMIRLGELEREAESNNLIFETFLQTYKRSNEQEELQEPDARVLSYAAVPTRPSYPDRLLMLSLATTLSLFVGLALAFLLEKLDNTFRSANQLENTGHFPCFALIPAVPEVAKEKASADYILSKPSSTLAESVRTLRTVLNLRAQKDGQRPKVVTMTSSFPGEGKTTLSCWLARLAAKSGERVLLIDCDLRRPSVHKALGRSNKHSLVEYLTGKETLEEVVDTGDPTGLHVIYGKSVPNSALDLVSSEKMNSLLAALRQTYDLIIIDSPACLAVSDARVLAMLSDHALYAVAWDRTPREVVMGGIKQFFDLNYDNMAFVLTNVDVRKHVRYGYGDTVYYYGRYKEYYAA